MHIGNVVDVVVRAVVNCVAGLGLKHEFVNVSKFFFHDIRISAEVFVVIVVEVVVVAVSVVVIEVVVKFLNLKGRAAKALTQAFIASICA